MLQVCKVYLGSFNDRPIRTDLNPHGRELFEKEQQNLLQDLYEIPQRSCDRKVSPFSWSIRLLEDLVKVDLRKSQKIWCHLIAVNSVMNRPELILKTFY